RVVSATLPAHPTSPFFPYTTLFRSYDASPATTSVVPMSVIEIPNLRNSTAHVNAPPHLARIDSIRRPPREPAPPASLESAARPVTVKVSTVVVRSGIASLRTTAFRNPIATAVDTIKRYTLTDVTSFPE